MEMYKLLTAIGRTLCTSFNTKLSLLLMVVVVLLVVAGVEDLAVSMVVAVVLQLVSVGSLEPDRGRKSSRYLWRTRSRVSFCQPATCAKKGNLGYTDYNPTSVGAAQEGTDL